ncbi:hypothetical protein PYCCODRAFT_1008064 [Trametes coccinea BRFM310]|uniref:Tyr recombinase domain-containing protein n=1 Tax=Trametes coccinea (strain BRFM310) TaxID=1353009 RepID=A0A1Y2IB73_TRAC3|nr:hypothetical protein PYCCODRAFT_1008064 [Trametes coccinea BRFM310]
MPRPPHTSRSRQVHGNQAVERTARSLQPYREQDPVRHRRCDMHQLATGQRMFFALPRRAARVLGLRRKEPWRQLLSSFAGSSTPSRLFAPMSGNRSYAPSVFSTHTPNWSPPYVTVSFPTSLPSTVLSPLPTAILYFLRQESFSVSLITNSPQDDTSARSLVSLWNLSLVPSNPPHCHSFLNPTSPTFFVSFKTSHSLDSLPVAYHPLIIILTLLISRALGALSTPSPFCVGASPRARKAPCATWQKHTESSLFITLNGQALSYDWRTTSLQSTPAPRSVWVHMPGYMVRWRTHARTSCELGAWVPWRNGSTTLFSCVSGENTWTLITSSGLSGESRSHDTEARDTLAGVCGSEEMNFQTAVLTSSSKTCVFPYAIWPTPPLAVRATPSTRTACPTSTRYLHLWASLGNLRKTTLSRRSFRSPVSSGSSTARARSAFRERKPTNTSPPSMLGCRSRRTTLRTSNNYMANSGMHRWSSSTDELFSSTWRPCSAFFTTVLSYRAPHLDTQPQTSSGGARRFRFLPSPGSYPAPAPSGTHSPTQTPAQAWASPWSSATAGGLGGSSRDGNQMAETSAGLRRWGSSSSSTPSWLFLRNGTATPSRPTETIGESSKVGGGAAAAIFASTKSSSASQRNSRSASRASSLATSQVPPILQMDRREESTPRPPCSFPPYLFLQNCSPSSSTSMPLRRLEKHAPARSDARPRSSQRVRTQATNSVIGAGKMKTSTNSAFTGAQRTGTTIKTRFDAALPPRSKKKRPPRATFRDGLQLNPSILRPACAASERLLKWTPSSSRRQRDANGNASQLSPEDVQRISDVSAFAWAESTLGTYGTGLLIFHIFCDLRNIPEGHRAPADELLILAFVASIAGSYAQSAINNYVAGVRAWHIIHGLPWNIDKSRYDAALAGAAQLAPPASKRPARSPLALQEIAGMAPAFTLDNSLDAAVWACLCVGFFSLARLGELTVTTQKSFQADLHPSRASLRLEAHRDGSEVRVIHLPRTKSAVAGEDISFARQDGAVDPWAALDNHLAVNQLAPSVHLFAYRKPSSNAIVPLTRRAFLARVKTAALGIRLPNVSGHSLRIGGTLEYLLRGLSFETVKAIGRWKSEAFTLYLRKHAQVLAPYLQDNQEALGELSRRTIQLPPVR